MFITLTGTIYIRKILIDESEFIKIKYLYSLKDTIKTIKSLG